MLADRRLLAALALLGAVALPIRPAGAQDGTTVKPLPPKRSLAGTTQSPCPPFRRPVAPPPEQQAESRRLAQQGYEAALGGDHTQARELLRRAAQLDVTSEQIAYRLGREHEEVEAPSDAVREYCRFLSLAPQAPDAADVRERIARLSPQRSLSESDVTAAQFGVGVGFYERGRLYEAQTAFAAVLAENPEAAPAYFNRGLVHASLGEPKLAIADLERYLRLQPQAPDRPAVERLLVTLRRQLLSPPTALGWGLAVPGGGQLYTNRRWIAGAVGATFLGATLFAIRPKTERHSTTDTNTFGVPYTSTRKSQSYPNLGLGLGVAAAAAIGGAVEAYMYAQRGRETIPKPPRRPDQRVGAAPPRVRRLQPLFTPSGDGRALLGARLNF
jgi:tetratricopeptide (TPR) repeat protein